MALEAAEKPGFSAVELLVSIALSGAFLWFAFDKVDAELLITRLQTLELGYVVAAVVATIGVQVLRAWRFARLMRPLAPNARLELLSIAHVGMFLIMFMPLRLGELARPYLLKRELAVPLSSGLGGAALERSLDGLCVALLFFIGTIFLGDQVEIPTLVKQAGWMTLALFSGFMVIIIFSLRTQSQVEKLIGVVTRLLPKAFERKAFAIYRGVVDGFRTLPDLRSGAIVVGLTVSVWLLNAFAFYSALLAFDWTFGFGAGLLLACILVIAIMIPAGPGFLGTYQAAMTMGLSLWGIGETDAAAYGLVVYPISLVVVVGFGAFGFLKLSSRKD